LKYLLGNLKKQNSSYYSFLKNKLYLGPDQRNWDPKISSLLKYNLDKKLILKEVYIKKSLKYCLVLLEELNINNKYLVVSPQKDRNPKLLVLNKRQKKVPLKENRLKKYEIPFALRSKKLEILNREFLKYKNQLKLKKEYQKTLKMSVLKNTFKNSNSIFVEKQWIAGSLTNRVSLNDNYFKFQYYLYIWVHRHHL
jgi:hypothetical protein